MASGSPTGSNKKMKTNDGTAAPTSTIHIPKNMKKLVAAIARQEHPKGSNTRMETKLASLVEKKKELAELQQRMATAEFQEKMETVRLWATWQATREDHFAIQFGFVRVMNMLYGMHRALRDQVKKQVDYEAAAKENGTWVEGSKNDLYMKWFEEAKGMSKVKVAEFLAKREMGGISGFVSPLEMMNMTDLARISVDCETKIEANVAQAKKDMAEKTDAEGQEADHTETTKGAAK